MSCRNVDGRTDEIGIKICEFEKQEKGHGTKLLRMLISYLFDELNFERIILDTNLDNKRAQHVYEKLGFTKLRVRYDCRRDQRGVLQSAVDYELKERALMTRESE